MKGGKAILWSLGLIGVAAIFDWAEPKLVPKKGEAVYTDEQGHESSYPPFGYKNPAQKFAHIASIALLAAGGALLIYGFFTMEVESPKYLSGKKD